MFRFQSVLATAIIGTAIAIPATVNAANFTFSLDPKSTFLRTNEDPFATDPLILELSALGISSGQEIFLQTIGDFAYGEIFEDTASLAIGVFSSTNELLSSDIFQRVPDAIDVVTPLMPEAITSPTDIGGLMTDIEEDFAIPAFGNSFFGDFATIIVPDEAQYLFVGTPDRFYSDNHDPDGDYGVKIWTESTRHVPEPSVLLGTVIVTALGWRYSRKLC